MIKSIFRYNKKKPQTNLAKRRILQQYYTAVILILKSS